MSPRLLLAAVLLGLGTPQLPAAFVPPPILMFHRIDVDRPPDAIGLALTIPPAQLGDELTYLRSQHVRGISLADLARRLELGLPLDRVVVLTFDDGYADQFRYAVPLLEKFGDSATFFIVSGDVGDGRHLSWAQLRRMRQARMDLGGHGVQHLDLSLMTPAEQRAQIDGCIAALRSKLGERVVSYAYPSGRLDRATLGIASGAGIELAVTTDPRFVLPPENRLELTRLRVRRGWSVAVFARQLERARAQTPVIVAGSI